MKFLQSAIDNGRETVDEKLRDEYVGAPTMADAKSALATLLSLESYGKEEMFDTNKMLNGGTGVYDKDVPLVIDEKKWYHSQQLFNELQHVRDSEHYLPPIIQHVFNDPPSKSVH